MKQLKNTFTLVLLVAFFALPATSWSQQAASYSMDVVRAVQFTSNNQNHILTILKVTPTVENFKMILSMRVTYEIGLGEKLIDVQKQKEDNIRISIYDKNLDQKNPKLYDLVKDHLNLNTQDDVRLLVFDFYNITEAQVDNMTLKYGLWEGKKEDIRNEKTFTFKVDSIN